MRPNAATIYRAIGAKTRAAGESATRAIAFQLKNYQ
jgi:hypothetical protein